MDECRDAKAARARNLAIGGPPSQFAKVLDELVIHALDSDSHSH